MSVSVVIASSWPAGGAISAYANPIKTCGDPWDACDNQDEDGLANYVDTKGPLAICVNAKGWQFYKSGVATAAICGGHDFASVDHCVQLVGYAGYSPKHGARGSGDGGAYWIVRNSWGEFWDELGYFRIKMGENQLGIEGECNWATPKGWTEHNTACFEDGSNCVTTATYTDPSERV